MKKPAAVVGKKGTKKDANKKPASNSFQPSKEEPMSLDEKIDKFLGAKNNQDIGDFLDKLSEHQRQALWQRFANARKALGDSAKEQWTKAATGPGSTPAKNKLLMVFLKAKGDLKNSTAYVNTLATLSKTTGTKHEEEWVPFARILQEYGLNEVKRRLSKGSIVAKKAEDDPDEWVFRLNKTIKYSDEQHHQQMGLAGSGKAELEQYIKMKGQLMPDFAQENSAGMEALNLNLGGGQQRGTKAPSRKETGEEESEDPDIARVETLSNPGDIRTHGEEKIKAMASLMDKMLKNVEDDKVKKVLTEANSELKKLKSKTKPKLDDVKTVLFNCALAVKQAKRMM